VTVIHVKKARKENKAAGIKVSDQYWIWSHQVGGRFVKQYFKTQPKRSQTTSSDFQAQAYDLEDTLIALVDDVRKKITFIDDIQGDLQALADEVRQLGAEQTEKRDNMPQGLQEGPTGEMLQERADMCESTVQTIEEAANEISNLDENEDWHDEVVAILEGISWEL